jgi:hypothetical protein
MIAVHRVSLFALTLTLIIGLSVPTQAQRSTDDDPPTLLKHLRNELQQEDLMRREAALMDIIALANCEESCTVSLHSIQDKPLNIEGETGKGAVVDLTALRSDLLNTYRKSPADAHRLMALSALLRIGDDKTLEKLLQKRPFQSDKVRRVTEMGLAQFYLEKYPELMEQATHTGQLSIRDVKRAKALRVKAEKKVAVQSNR